VRGLPAGGEQAHGVFINCFVARIRHEPGALAWSRATYHGLRTALRADLTLPHMIRMSTLPDSSAGTTFSPRNIWSPPPWPTWEWHPSRRQVRMKSGGKPRLDRERVKELSDTGLGPAAIARELGMARSSVYRLLGEASQTS